ncbi:MAG: hypothetical protein J6X28_00495 [Bacilli bacterium]|nr:hypothetical protein [Bacilli bacterium]
MSNYRDGDIVFNPEKVKESRDLMDEIREDLYDADVLLYDAVMKVGYAMGIQYVEEEEPAIDMRMPEKLMIQCRDDAKTLSDNFDYQVKLIEAFLYEESQKTSPPTVASTTSPATSQTTPPTTSTGPEDGAYGAAAGGAKGPTTPPTTELPRLYQKPSTTPPTFLDAKTQPPSTQPITVAPSLPGHMTNTSESTSTLIVNIPRTEPIAYQPEPPAPPAASPAPASVAVTASTVPTTFAISTSPDALLASHSAAASSTTPTNVKRGGGDEAHSVSLSGLPTGNQNKTTIKELAIPVAIGSAAGLAGLAVAASNNKKKKKKSITDIPDDVYEY